MRKTFVLVALVIALVAAACDPPEEKADDRGDDRVDVGDLQLIGLTTEDTCTALLDWFKKEASAYADAMLQRGYGEVIAYGTDARATAEAGAAPAPANASASTSADKAAAAPVAGTDYSATNVQEEGVDEPDIVKTDGRRLVTLAGGHLRVVDLTGDKPVLRASVPLPGAQALFLAGDRVVAITMQSLAYPMVGGVRTAPAVGAPAPGIAVDDVPPGVGPTASKTTVTVVDISDVSQPKVEATQELDGDYVAARMTDGVVRLVLRTTAQALIQQFAYPTFDENGKPVDQEKAAERNRSIIGASKIEDWVPSYVPCEQVHHPKGFTGPSMINVVTVDPADPRPGNGASVAGAGDTVYASQERLYVTSQQWQFAMPVPVEGDSATTAATGPTTEIHAFDISDDVTTRYVGSGSVDGTLLNQFSLSEYEGVLRVATTTVDRTNGQSESAVVTLRPGDGKLEQIGAIGGLGKAERIYAVRFIGPVGYVVTFRQMDPLYVLDLSDPATPVLKGELKIPGYSAYLHPIGDGRLIGIGQNASDQGRRLGAQLSLFDVSDPANPKQLATHDLGTYGSTAEYDHHAFLWWARTKLVVVPVEGYVSISGAPNGQYRPGAKGLTIDGDRIDERATIEHPTHQPVTRSVVVGSHLLTLSDTGLLESDLDSLQAQEWLAF